MFDRGVALIHIVRRLCAAFDHDWGDDLLGFHYTRVDFGFGSQHRLLDHQDQIALYK